MVLMVANVNVKINGQYILKEITFSLKEGDFVCITGPSGCGKTTLLRLVSGLIQPTSGSIYLNGNLAGSDSNIGYVFQEGALFPWLTVFENVAFGLDIRRVSHNEKIHLVQDILNTVELDGFENYYPKELSGGMRMRVALARVLVYQPKLILMDEPFASLDSRTRNRLQNDMVRLWQRHKQTILMVTHNIDEAVYLSNRIIVLQGRPGQIIRNFDVPFARPRDRTEREFSALRRKILTTLGE